MVTGGTVFEVEILALTDKFLGGLGSLELFDVRWFGLSLQVREIFFTLAPQIAARWCFLSEGR